MNCKLELYAVIFHAFSAFSMAPNGIGCSGLKADIRYEKCCTHTLPNDDDDDSVFSKRTVKTKLSNWKRQMNWIYKLVEVINDKHAVPPVHAQLVRSFVSMDFLLDKSSRAFPKTEMHSKSVLRYGVVWHVIYGEILHIIKQFMQIYVYSINRVAVAAVVTVVVGWNEMKWDRIWPPENKTRVARYCGIEIDRIGPERHISQKQ